MATEIATGSQTATLATDHTLTTQTVPAGGAAYVLRVNASALTGEEVLTLTLSTKVRTSDSFAVEYRSVWSRSQSEPNKVSPIIVLQENSQLKCELRQEGGTGRAFPWALLDASRQ